MDMGHLTWRPRTLRAARWQSRLLQPRIQAPAFAGASGRPAIHAVPGGQARLRRALVAVAAGDRPGLITRVFGPQ
jgi:hypothetical protein